MPTPATHTSFPEEPSSYVNTQWQAGMGSVSIYNNMLEIDGERVLDTSVNYTTPGISVTFRAAFPKYGRYDSIGLTQVGSEFQDTPHNTGIAFQTLGDTTEIYAAIVDNDVSLFLKAVQNNDEKTHTYQFIWTSNCVVFFVDGIQVAEFIGSLTTPNLQFGIDDLVPNDDGIMTVQSVDIDTCSDFPESNCVQGVLRSQCEDASGDNEFNVFTPYPDGTTTGCLPVQPCREQCGPTACQVSAFVQPLDDGDSVIEYFLTGACVGITELDIDTHNAAGSCAIPAGQLACGFIAPRASPYFDEDFNDEGSSSESSSESSSSFSQSKATAKCVVSHSHCSGSTRLSIPIDPTTFRGVALHVSHHFNITVGGVSLSTSACTEQCELLLPVPQCLTPTTDDDDDDAANNQLTTPLDTPDLSDLTTECDTPSAAWIASHTSPSDQRVAAQAFLNAYDVELMSLMMCAPGAVASSDPTTVAFPAANTDVACDYTQCAQPPAASQTVGGYLTYAETLFNQATTEYAMQKFNAARQSVCCAEYIVNDIAKGESTCATTASPCSVAAIYPGAGSIAAYEAELASTQGALPGTRKRSAASDAPYANAQASTEQASASVQRTVLFEECGVPHGNYVPDNDINDAVYATTATSFVDHTTKYWVSSVLHITPVALGTLRDFAVDWRFTDAGVFPGSEVRVVHYGIGATTTCYTANGAGSAECPPADSARLYMSARAALPQHTGAGSPFINTLPNMARATMAHTTVVLITLPIGYKGVPTLKYAFELRDRETSCVTKTIVPTVGAAGGVGLVVPSPFLYPLEGVPAYLNATQVPRGGVCVGGAQSSARCSEKQECAGGYCETHENSANSLHCIDAPQPGVNLNTFCSRKSQCPYGRCYASDESLDQHGAYPALAEFLRTRGTQNTAWFAARTPPGQIDETVYYDPAAHSTK